MSIKLGKKLISRNKDDVYLIAEAGVNHEGDITVAKEMVRQAALAGADAIKFQTYKAEKLAVKKSPAYWNTKKETSLSQYELFRKFDSFGEKEYIELATACREVNIDFLSTPFDIDAANFLNPLSDAFKIASADINNYPLLKHIAKFNKPIILSTGASTLGEIEEAVKTIKEQGNNLIALLHCILSYPTDYENANLNMIEHLLNTFPDRVIGYSDHTLPDPSMLVLTTAYMKGAKIIEKHFTLTKFKTGNDHYHAMNPDDIIKFNNNLKLLKQIGGLYYKQPVDIESAAIQYARRSLVANKKIIKNTVITEDMLTWKRPGTGISPNFIDKVIGMISIKDIEEDEIIQWDFLSHFNL